MQKKTAVAGMALILSAAGCLSADAAWVVQNKPKQVSALKGFQDSANGAVQNILPWNWVGGEQPKKRRNGYVTYH